jgi:hypothetical protein
MIKLLYRLLKKTGFLFFFEKIKILTIKLEKHEIIPIHKKSLITVFFGTFGGISFLIHDFYTNFNARLYFLNIKKKSNQLRQYNYCLDDKLNKVIVLSVLESILLDNSKIKNQTIEYPNILKNEKYVFINNSQENNSIIINKSGGFFHFYIEVIPILLRLKNYNIYFVIENKDFYHSVLKFYNINYFDVDLENIGKIENFKMDKYYPSSKDISWFKSYNDKIKVIRTAPKKIYITRRNERARRISNENELFYYLSKMGYELIDPGKLNFKDQVIYFKNAEYIVSAHGAALSNIIWCKSSVKIIELNGSQDVRWHFAKMANTLNLNYTLLTGKTIDNVYFEIHIDSLKKVLEDNY